MPQCLPLSSARHFLATFLPPRHRHILEHSLEALVSKVRGEVAADEPELAPHHLEHLFDFDKVESVSDESRQFPRRYLLRMLQQQQQQIEII